jgi:hypothetical protein
VNACFPSWAFVLLPSAFSGLPLGMPTAYSPPCPDVVAAGLDDDGLFRPPRFLASPRG